MRVRELCCLIPAEDLILSLSIYTNIHTSKKPSPFLCCSYFMFMFYNRLNSCTLFRTLCNHMFIYVYTYIHFIIMALVKNMCTASLFFLLTIFLLKFIKFPLILQIQHYNLPFFKKKEGGNSFTLHCGQVSKGRIVSRTSRVPLSAFDLC